MSLIKGYFVTSHERDLFQKRSLLKKSDTVGSEEFILFIENLLKIGAFFAIYHNIDEVNFNKKQKDLFTESAAIFYTEDALQIQELKKYAKQALINQTIVAIVSNWEAYFSRIFQTIFNDPEFLEFACRSENNPRFQKILERMKIDIDFNEKKGKPGKNAYNFKFGTNIIEKRRINFQDVSEIAKLMNCFDLDIVDLSKKIDSEFWGDITKLVKTRQIIVHEQDHTVEGRSLFRNVKTKKNKKISDVYTMKKLLEFSVTMHQIINRADLILFSEYDIR